MKHLANPGQGAAEFPCHLTLREFFQLDLEGDFPGLDDGIPVRLPGHSLFYWLVEPCQVPQSGSLGDPVGVPVIPFEPEIEKGSPQTPLLRSWAVLPHQHHSCRSLLLGAGKPHEVHSRCQGRTACITPVPIMGV